MGCSIIFEIAINIVENIYKEYSMDVFQVNVNNAFRYFEP